MMPRSFRVFAIVFAVVFTIAYVISVEQNYALFSYHPALDQFGMGVEQPLDGPVMYWYGWLATATLVASVLPHMLSQRP